MRTKYNTKNGTGAEVAMQANFRQMMAINAQSALTTLLRRGVGGRSGFSTGNGRRDIELACGYIKDLTYNDYFDVWDRMDVAARVVAVYPDYTWIQNPDVYEDERESVSTKFEKDWIQHVRENRPFAELHKLDVLAGIGKFGLLVMGINDGKRLDTPLMPFEATALRKRSISYYRAYTEGEVKIMEWDDDLFSPRYGKPVMYEITPNAGAESMTYRVTPINEKTSKLSENPTVKPFKVHYSRCIHFADNALCGDTFGIERLKRVYNRLSDIIKIVGGSAEMFWQGAFSGISFEMDPEAEISDDDKQKMRVDIDNYVNQMQRTLLLQGVKANPLSPTITGPMDHLDAQLTLISIASSIPKRILTGSEMGKLASTQDSENWGLQVQTRRTNIAGPYLLENYTRFCITNGIVRSPKTGLYGFSTEWPELSVMTKEQKADAAEAFSTALETYCTKSLYHAIDFANYLYHFHGFSSKEAKALSKKFDKSAFEKIRKEAQESKKNSLASEPTKTASAKAKSKAKIQK